MGLTYTGLYSPPIAAPLYSIIILCMFYLLFARLSAFLACSEDCAESAVSPPDPPWPEYLLKRGSAAFSAGSGEGGKKEGRRRRRRGGRGGGREGREEGMRAQELLEKYTRTFLMPRSSRLMVAKKTVKAQEIF